MNLYKHANAIEVILMKYGKMALFILNGLT
jgi:hypothetical protein